MNTSKKPLSKELQAFIEKIKSEAASQDKYFDTYLAERSDGLRTMFIRWHKEAIAELEQITSQSE